MKIKTIILYIVLVIVIVYAVSNSIRFSRDIGTARERLRGIDSQVLKTEYGDIEYRLAGDGDETVLISHGITGGVDQGEGLAGTYMNGGYRFLYVSRFGYLGSGMPGDATPQMQADAYDALLTHLGIESVYVLGNSAGGTAAFHFALDHGDRCEGLILLSSNMPQTNEVLPPEPVIKAIFGSDFMYWWTVQSFDTMLFKMFMDSSLLASMSREDRRRLRDTVLMPGLPITERSDGVFYDMFVSNPSLTASPIRYEDIAAPTLILHAADDPGIPVASARGVAEKIDGAVLKVFDEGGHLFVGHEGEIRTAIDGFIRH